MLKLPLYPYQEAPVKKFLERGNLLVSFEMGTGKTAIAIACAEQIQGTCLIVCPASLRAQWALQIKKFTGYSSATDVIIVPGTPPIARQSAYDQFHNMGAKYIIMSYETVVGDARWVRRIKPAMVVLDEASAIKTFKAKRTKKVKQILKAEYRLALTGTPMENRPDEVFSIMQWVDESVLGRWDLFEKTYIERDQFGSVTRYKNLPVLHKRLSVAQSRAKRTDPEVKPYLPDEDYGVWYCDMLPEQRTVYKSMAKDALIELDNAAVSNKFDVVSFYSGESGMEKFGPLAGILISMKMFLDHPDLCVVSAMKFKDNRGGSRYCHEKWQEDLFDNSLHSSKLDLLKAEVNKALAFEDSKVIIFTQYKEMVQIIADHLEMPYIVYHGDMNSAAKHQAVQYFADKNGPRIFISTHAGAYGTDMYMANYLIQYDLPDSHGKDSQIKGRATRAASEFDKIFIRDIVMRDTIEERILARTKFKKSVADAIVDDVQANDTGHLDNEVESLRNNLTRTLGHGKVG